MNFKNISIILTFLSFSLNGLSSPINVKEVSSNAESSDDEVVAIDSDIEVVSDATSDTEVETDNEECLTQECYEASKRILTSMDTTVNPCEDFYQFTCGNWINNNEIPSSQIYKNGFVTSQMKNTETISEIFKGDYPINENLSKEDQELDKKIFNQVKTLYSTCMDEESINKKGKEPLMNLLNKLDLHNNKTKYKGADGIANLIADLQYYGVDSFLKIENGDDIENKDIIVVGIIQPDMTPELGLYYSKEVLPYYKNAVNTTLVKLFGEQKERNIEEMTNTIIDLESKLYSSLLSLDYLQNPNKIYNKSSVKKLMSDYPNINWKLYFQKMYETYEIKSSLDDNTFIVNETPEYFEALNKIILESDIDSLLTYAEWVIIMKYINDLPNNMNESLKELNKASLGIDEKTRSEKCVSLISNIMGSAVGKYYVEKSLSKEYKKAAEEFTKNIKQAMIERIPKMEWLDDQTREYAIKKVNKINDIVGYPDYILKPQELIKEYEGLEIFSDDFFTNDMNSNMFGMKQKMKLIDQPANKEKWNNPPQTANAYYIPLDNSILLPAGILQPPFYDSNEPDYLNYGALGSIIGHELTHAFDNTGKSLDGDGRLVNWWTDSTLDKFNVSTECFVDQYNQFTVVDSEGIEKNINGTRTLNENLADNGGLSRAYEAWNLSRMDNEKFNEHNKKLPGISYTPDQLFYIAFGQGWCSIYRPTYISLFLEDVHSISKFRVNGVVSNSKHFAETFECPIGSKMNPENKCSIW